MQNGRDAAGAARYEAFILDRALSEHGPTNGYTEPNPELSAKLIRIAESIETFHGCAPAPAFHPATDFSVYDGLNKGERLIDDYVPVPQDGIIAIAITMIVAITITMIVVVLNNDGLLRSSG